MPVRLSDLSWKEGKRREGLESPGHNSLLSWYMGLEQQQSKGHAWARVEHFGVDVLSLCFKYSGSALIMASWLVASSPVGGTQDSI